MSYILSDAELLAQVAKIELARASLLLEEVGGLRGLRRSIPDSSITPSERARISLAVELATRLASTEYEERKQIKSPSDVADMLMFEMGHLDQEQLRTVLLDTKNRVQDIVTVYQGSVHTALVRTCEIFKTAVARNSTAIVLAHNHPSGDPTPSPEDVLVTRQISSAGKMLDIELLDHLVIGHGRFVSMRERGLGWS